MSSASKGDRKASLDAASWLFNVVTSVGIILVNKALMATYGFSFGMASSLLFPFSYPLLNLWLVMPLILKMPCFFYPCVFGYKLLILCFPFWYDRCMYLFCVVCEGGKRENFFCYNSLCICVYLSPCLRWEVPWLELSLRLWLCMLSSIYNNPMDSLYILSVSLLLEMGYAWKWHRKDPKGCIWHVGEKLLYRVFQ